MDLSEAEELEVPESARTLDAFREWVAGLEEGAPRVHFWRGSVTLEVGQDLRVHAPLTQAVNHELAGLVERLDLGMYFSTSIWWTCEQAGLSTEPDGFLASWNTFESGDLRQNPDRQNELLGRPDLALEVVSETSATKDTVELVEAHARAGVGEYWIADGRDGRAQLRILVLEDGSYREQPADDDGWLASPTFGRSFRLRRFTNRAGLPDFELEVREG